MVRLAPGKDDGKSELDPAAAMPSVPVMTGTHFNVLDEKGRITIPAKLRPALTEQFWMMLDENDNIAIYNYQTGLDVLEHCERMIAEYPGNEDIAAAVERITGAADLVRVEGGWRVPLSEVLRFYAQLDKEVVTVGIINHAVIWAREKWEAAQARRLQSPEVRKAQAEMLRAAASSVRRTEVQPTVAEPVEQINVPAIATGIATGTAGAIPGVVGAAGGGGAGKPAPAPAGDGKRGARVLSLSQLGR
jgi:MraZ protein